MEGARASKKAKIRHDDGTPSSAMVPPPPPTDKTFLIRHRSKTWRHQLPATGVEDGVVGKKRKADNGTSRSIQDVVAQNQQLLERNAQLAAENKELKALMKEEQKEDANTGADAAATGGGAGAAASAAAMSQAYAHTDDAAARRRRNLGRAQDTRFRSWQVGDRYQLRREIGKGSYGSVAVAFDRQSGEEVAVKQIRDVFRNQVDARRILRELHILHHLRPHPYIIDIGDVIMPPDPNNFKNLYITFELMPMDLQSLVEDKAQWLTGPHSRLFLFQLLLGVQFIHSANVVHRDLKPANILLREDCTLKICDFGLARVIAPQQSDGSGSARAGAAAGGALGSQVAAAQSTGKNDEAPRGFAIRRQYSTHVVTRWYRAPELVLCNSEYSCAVDVWSIGCIFAEILSCEEGTPPERRDQALFPGSSCALLSPGPGGAHASIDDQRDQINVIFDVIGRPSNEEIARVGRMASPAVRAHLMAGHARGLGAVGEREPDFAEKAKQMYPMATPEAVSLLDRMLTFDPSKRVTVKEALSHAYLDSTELVFPDGPATTTPLKLDFDQAKNEDLSLASLRKLHASFISRWHSQGKK